MAKPAKKLSEAERKRKLEELKELERQEIALLEQKKKYQQDNAIEFLYVPPRKGHNPAQRRLVSAWLNPMLKVFTFTGANRIGKTFIGAQIGEATLFGKYLWDNADLLHLFGHSYPRKVRYIGQDWEKHIGTVVIPELRKWWPQNRPLKTKKNSLGYETLWTDLSTGSTLEIMSNNQDSDLHEGWSGDLIIYDEPPKRAVRIANARGLIDRGGRELFCMTLLKEAWVDQEVVKAKLEDGRPDNTVFNINADITVNVGYGITQEHVDQFAKILNPEEKEARLRGVPSYMSGLVLKYFNREQHVVDRFSIPSDYMVDIGFDIHPRKEQAVLFVATDPKNERYVCFEIWEHGDGTQVAEHAMRIVSRYNLRVNRIVIDPLAKGDANAGITTYDKISDVLMRHGYLLEVASKDKESGILEINNHLRGPNNKPSIFIFNDLIRTLAECEGWMYDKETQKPQKVMDDMMENLYRILLLDTKYEMPDIEEDLYEEPVSVNEVTGY